MGDAGVAVAIVGSDGGCEGDGASEDAGMIRGMSNGKYYTLLNTSINVL